MVELDPKQPGVPHMKSRALMDRGHRARCVRPSRQVCQDVLRPVVAGPEYMVAQNKQDSPDGAKKNSDQLDD